METLITALIPALSAGGVYVVVAGIKKIQAIRFSDDKKPVLRLTAALLSFLGVVVLSATTGQTVDNGAVVEIVNLLISTALAYAGATGIHTLKNS